MQVCPANRFMAVKATIYKIELQISDMDRHYYASHALTLARHPSETDERLMVRVLAFALHAEDRLEFGKGLSTDEEPDLWLRERNGDIGLWIDLGQPELSRIRKACSRSHQVVVVNYGGRSADLWWGKIEADLRRFRNLTVLDIDAGSVASLGALAERGLRLQCLIQDRHVQMFAGEALIGIDPRVRMSPSGAGA